MENIIKIGPRALFHQANGTWFTQIVKYVQNSDGSFSRFILDHEGLWRSYESGHAFSADETFVIPADRVHELTDLEGKPYNVY